MSGNVERLAERVAVWVGPAGSSKGVVIKGSRLDERPKRVWP